MAGAAFADNVPFSRGALIIPMESTFQSQAGSVSAYGLVYRILQANQAGHRNASAPVTIYIANDPTKQSVNRCKPTNTAVLDAAVSTPADPKWNDGCDFSIENLTEQPVVNVTWGAWPAAGSTFAVGPLNTFVSTEAWPRYNALSAANLTTPNFTKITYSGGPFIIDAADAQKVWDLLKSGDTGANAFPLIAFSPFITSCTAAAASTMSSAVATVSNIEYSSACHYVNMHQATVGFNAQVERRITVPPPPFALFDPSFGNGTAGSAGVLDKYLKISGLWLRSTAAGATNGNDSQGCAIGNVSGCTVNGSSGATAGTPATAAQAKAGSIYNRMGLADLRFTDAAYPTGILNQKTGAYPTYRLYWAPHWDSNNAADSAAFVSLTAFVQSGGNMMAECASIGSFEGSIGSAASPPRFMFTNGIDYVNTTLSSNLRNCSDPGQGKPCADFLAPGNIFSQVADWMFDGQSGTVSHQRPKVSTGSLLRTYVSRMLVYRNDADLTDDYDVFDMGQEDDQKGVMIYVGGHDVSAKPLGARIVLNSMLNLGGVPISSERALAGPTIVYASANAPAYVDQVITPTFSAVSGYSGNAAVRNFDSSNVPNQKRWVWPYYPGHFRSHSMSGLSAGEQSFTSSLIFDSSELNTPTGISPSPGLRNLITWVGGYPKDYSSTTMAGGANAPNNQLQGGWKPEAIDGEKFDTTMACPPVVTNCVDVMGYDARVTTPTFDGLEPGLHMVVGADGLCDVQQMLNFSKVNSGNDWGNPSCAPANIAKFINETPAAAWLVQRVRGFCYTGVNADFSPGDGDCTDLNDNRAHLGGFVHSTAAVLEPSPNIVDNGAPRPTVAFAAAYDGQLHAFYIGGGDGYTGPNGVTFNEDNHPAAKFKKDWAADFASGTAVPRGTELWSFLPASQLPWLETNGAQVDSSPVVMDVFADFSGTGIREWHSVLLLSLGRQSTELLALDVTNPLLPRLLWDNTGSLFQIGSTPKFSPNILMTDSLGQMPGPNLAPKYEMVWDNAVPSKFRQNFVGYQKAYDYRDLGGTAGLTSSQIRVGLEPAYVVFAVSNMSAGRQGIQVYAIEASTGQMMWQWERPYDGPGPSDNAVPVVATVLTGADGAGVLLVGDHEGRIWELDAATGQNIHVSTDLAGCTTALPCQFPAFDTVSTAANPQPITTNIAVARVPSGIAPGLSLQPYENERVLIFGTAGADWISDPTTVAGRLHVALYETPRQVPVQTVGGLELDGITAWTAGSVLLASAKGVMQEVPDFPRVFALGERVHGTITVAGSVAYFATAYDKIGDVMAVSPTVQGQTYSVNLGTADTGALTAGFAGTRASYGGVAVYRDKGTGAFKGVVSSQTGSMNYTPAASMPAAVVTASTLNPALTVNNNQGLAYRLMGWIRRLLR
ncbi:MAG: hypothetical protein Q8L48_21965 [Archangium sp.]|nr:hypothetical protein [Archangium sp.]